MTEPNDIADPRGNTTPIQEDGLAPDLQQVQDLTWALLDELITDDERALLNEWLCNSADARATYLRCVQLHADLSGHFAAPPAPAPVTTTKTPVLGLLSSGIIPLELQLPPGEQPAR